MSFTRSIVGAAAVALIATLPTVAGAQSRARTACKDGSTTTSMASNACDAHGGMDRGRTEAMRRTPGADTRHETGPVAQAGSPSPSSKPRYQEEQRGWRWHRHHDEPRAEERRERRYRCRDGRYETVHGEARGREVCRHHGGLAH